MNRDEKAVHEALESALETVRDHVPDPRLRAKVYEMVENAYLIHKGSLRA